MGIRFLIVMPLMYYIFLKIILAEILLRLSMLLKQYSLEELKMTINILLQELHVI